MKNPIFLLCLFETGLYAARLAGLNRIPVYGFDHEPKNIGFYSRFIVPYYVPDPQQNEQQVLEILLNKRSEFSVKPVLIAASEKYLEFIQRKRSVLEKYFLFILPLNNTLQSILNKVGQFKLAANCGLLVPHYQIVKPTDDIYNLAESTAFPSIIKGLNQTLWKTKVLEKAYIINGKLEFVRVAKNLCEKQIPFIVQQVIPGDCSNNFEFNAIAYNGQIINKSVIKKIRQYPLGVGVACCVETVKNETVEKLGTQFILANNIDGFSNTEFKFDSNKQQYYFIETNARVWQQVALTNSIGINFVDIYYRLLTNRKQNSTVAPDHLSVKWVDILSDTLLFFRYKKVLGISIVKYIKTFNNVKDFGLFYIKDIKPFLKEIEYGGRFLNIFRKRKAKIGL